MSGNHSSRTLVRVATPGEVAAWDDLVTRFPNHRLVHRAAWLRSLEVSGVGRLLRLVFERDGDIAGCLPGLLVRLGPIRLFGSPLAGWQTVSLGPAYDPTRLTTADIVTALVPYLEEQHGVHHVELMCGGLDGASMAAAGFRGEPVITYRAQLHPEDPAATFRAFKESARRNVRRAEKLGLVIRFEDDESFVEEHYDQVREVYARNGYAVPFSKRRVLESFRQMRAAGQLVAVSVRLPDVATCVATGMFFQDGRELLLWTWTHRTHYRWYRPTELMTWAVMQRAMAAGCTSLDFMGGGEFKARFGAEPDLSKIRWIRSRYHWLSAARSAAEHGYRWQQALRGRLGQLRHALADRVARPGPAVRHSGDESPLLRGKQSATRRRPPACVLGDMDLVRPLGLAGIPCAVVAPPGAPPRFSRFTDAALAWADAWHQPDVLTATLLAFGAAQPERPVLFYEADPDLLLVSRQRAALAQAFRFVIPDATLVEDLVDKERFQRLAARLDLPVPPARSLDTTQQRPRDLGLRFPVVLKPLTRRPESWDPVAGGAKALRVDTPADLAALWPRLARAGLPLLAQELVAGPEQRIESYHAYVRPGGAVVGEFTGRKIRTWPLERGDSSALELTDAPDVAELGRDVLARLKFSGVVKIDFKRDPAGRLWLLEINPRFNLWHHLGAVAGVNLPALVYADLTGGATRQSTGPARVGARWCRPWADWRAARSLGGSWWHWLAWAVTCDAKCVLAWDDPMPLLGAAVWRLLWSPRRAAVPPSPTPPAPPAPPAPAAAPVPRPSAVDYVLEPTDRYQLPSL